LKNATRLDEIDDFLRDGGSLDDLLIEPEPSGYTRNFSKAGMEVDMRRGRDDESNCNRKANRYRR
jgi:hypothetical protein